jgi:hypothetical protein
MITFLPTLILDLQAYSPPLAIGPLRETRTPGGEEGGGGWGWDSSKLCQINFVQFFVI